MPQRNKPRISLASVITKVRQISRDSYNGKVYDNILSIFNQLTTVEKRVLLRGLIGFALMVEEKIISETEDPDPVKKNGSLPTTKEEVVNTEQQLEVHNQKALVEMKVWGFKVGFVILVMFLLGGLAAAVLLSGDLKMLERLESLKDIYDIVMGG